MNDLSNLLRRIIDRAFNQGDLGILDDLVAAGSVTHAGRWGIPANRSGLKLFVVAFRAGFPDLHCTVEDEIREGDRLAAHWIMCGTHYGPYLGNPPTGRRITVQGMLYARIEKGQIVENWLLVDQMGLLQQLGLIPPPAVSPFSS
jgi:predicted ester cyclase